MPNINNLCNLDKIASTKVETHKSKFKLQENFNYFIFLFPFSINSHSKTHKHKQHSQRSVNDLVNPIYLLEKTTSSSNPVALLALVASTSTVTISVFRVLAMSKSYSDGTITAKKLSLSSLRQTLSTAASTILRFSASTSGSTM